jgi:RTX calcium-binding nonapeptide repeat (4 copies)
MRFGGAILVTALALTVLVASGATAAERVTDGGFEQTTCPGDGYSCTNPFWVEAVPEQGFACRAPSCASGPASGSGFGTLGSDNILTGAHENGSLEQPIDLPSTPATLRFKLKAPLPPVASVPQATLTVGLGQSPVFSFGPPDYPGYASYTPVSVPIPASIPAGSHVLRFSVSCDGGASDSTCPRFDVDEVSVDSLFLCNGRPATIEGTDFAETLRGTAGPDVIAALGGKDVVRSGRGNDQVCGGAGKDRLNGQGGRDTLLGEGGKDKLSGGGGRGDRCKGGPGKDTESDSCEK